MTPKTTKQEEDDVDNFVSIMRGHFFQTLKELSKGSPSDFAYDNYDSIIDDIDDLITHARIQGENSLHNKSRKICYEEGRLAQKIEDFKEFEKMIDKTRIESFSDILYNGDIELVIEYIDRFKEELRTKLREELK